MTKYAFLFYSILVAGGCYAQKQLVLLDREQVLLRLNPGDDFSFRLKNSKRIWRTYVNNLSDTAVVTHRDTIPYHKIDRVYFKRVSFINKIGTVLVIGGAGYFLIDQVNNVIVNGNDVEFDRGVTRTSVTTLAIGLPMMLIRKNFVRLRGRSRLLMVTEESPFYFDSRPKGYVSPYIPR